MSKRFIDTDLWERNWFLKLTPEERQAFVFIFCKCDCIGIYRYNIMHSYVLGGISVDDLASKINGHLEKLEEDKYWLPSFCYFQYGNLTEDCRPHKKYIEELKKQKLFKRVSKGYSKGINTLQEKEKEKDKEKDIEKEQEIYKLYPRKEGKAKAIEAITKALKKVDYQYLLDAVSEYAESMNGHPDKTMIPHPTTWFNQERWSDDRSMWSAWRNQPPQNNNSNPFAGFGLS
jgi:hypothetical protein